VKRTLIMDDSGSPVVVVESDTGATVCLDLSQVIAIEVTNGGITAHVPGSKISVLDMTREDADRITERWVAIREGGSAGG
jgi:hypothetical protein